MQLPLSICRKSQVSFLLLKTKIVLLENLMEKIPFRYLTIFSIFWKRINPYLGFIKNINNIISKGTWIPCNFYIISELITRTAEFWLHLKIDRWKECHTYPKKQEETEQSAKYYCSWTHQSADFQGQVITVKSEEKLERASRKRQDISRGNHYLV